MTHSHNMNCSQTVSLNGSWQVRQCDHDEWIPATVPGCVHTDLLAAKRIADPLVGTNELDVLWIDETDWEYERSFELDESFVARKAQWLICEGLDTIAEIAINGRPVAATRNMFRRYRFDVRRYVRVGTNHIRIIFRSPIRYGRERCGESPYELPGSEYAWSASRTRKVYRPYVRKSQCQFGWDWGPCLATSGIWRAIRLIATDAAPIDYVCTQQHHDGDGVHVVVRAHLLCTTPDKGRLEVAIGGTGEPCVTTAELRPGENTIQVEVPIKSPQLWWPIGLGKPHLYTLSVRWHDSMGIVCDESVVRIGLRQVELVQQPDAWGESFAFRINGREVFCKGANWIPADAFPSRINYRRYETLIDSAVDANMNMLRVWGGGLYEDESFYRLCDERGVMVWQDFMFAWSAYPADEAFLGEVASEVRHQIRRLINHPSIVLWCGNNENEWMISEELTPLGKCPPLRPDYERLTTDTIAPIVREEDPQRPWWPSSPSNGGTGAANSPARGDTHSWDVWQWGQPLEHYRDVLPRFCSEFGFQALPSPWTLRDAVGSEARSIDSPMMRHHQRHLRGNEIITETVERYFGKPTDFDELCYFSQIVQGLALKTAVEHWRRGKPRCMGTLYWQLQDCWVVTSWATIDYALRYKAAHFFAKRFYAPLLGSIVETDGELQFWATSDVPSDIEVSYEIQAWHVDGHLLHEDCGRLHLEAQANRCCTSVSRECLIGSQAAPEEVLVRLILRGPGRRHENIHALVPFKELNLRQANVRAGVESNAEGTFVTLATNVPALFVELDSGDQRGVFSDNYFALFPDDPLRVEFTSADSDDARELAHNLRTRWLFAHPARG